jgi:hypothetical protein
MKQSGGKRWSLEIKLASDRPQQYSLDIGGNGDANTQGRRMALIKPLVEIQGDKSNLLRAQRTRAIQQELTRTLAALDNIHSHCAKSTGETETGVGFDGNAYWNLAESFIDRIGNMLEATLQQSFQCGEIPNSGVFENDGYLSLDMDALQTFPTSKHLKKWLEDFAEALLQQRSVSSQFASHREIVEFLSRGFDTFIVKALLSIKKSYDSSSTSMRSGSLVTWTFDSKTTASNWMKPAIDDDVEKIRSESHRFILDAEGALKEVIARSEATSVTHGKNRAALAAKNIEKTEAALGLAAHLLEAHRSQLPSSKN